MSKKKSKTPKSENPVKILRWLSREDEFERNGGGQWVVKDRAWKNKKAYDRKRDKKIDLDSSFYFPYL